MDLVKTLARVCIQRYVDAMPKTPTRSIRIPDDEWQAALEATKAKGETVSNVVREALRRFVASAILTAMLVIGAMSGTRPGEFTLFGGVCKSVAVCERNADIGPAVDAMIAEQVATFGPTCVAPATFKGIPARVLIRNAHMTDGDTGVVRAVTLDTALAGAKIGKVFVLKACA
jgi:hypothetical protein